MAQHLMPPAPRQRPAAAAAAAARRRGGGYKPAALSADSRTECWPPQHLMMKRYKDFPFLRFATPALPSIGLSLFRLLSPAALLSAF